MVNRRVLPIFYIIFHTLQYGRFDHIFNRFLNLSTGVSDFSIQTYHESFSLALEELASYHPADEKKCYRIWADGVLPNQAFWPRTKRHRTQPTDSHPGTGAYSGDHPRCSRFIWITLKNLRFTEAEHRCSSI